MARWPRNEEDFPQEATAGGPPDDGTAAPGPPATDWEFTSSTVPPEKTSAATAPAFDDAPPDDNAPPTSATKATIPTPRTPSDRGAGAATGQSASQPVGSAGAWGTLDASGEPIPGQVIFNRYYVLERLGRGGMGSVWLVRHTELQVERALKLIVAGIAQDPQARARFRREAQVMAKFSHPNAVIVHDARLTESDVAYIDMELVPGQSLDKVFKKGTPMPLDWTARILVQLCEVLQVGHEQGIVHRDLKPSNLMLVDGRPPGQEHLKVLDFGIAKVLGVEDHTGGPHTMTGAFMGTPPYTSPEQAEGRADPRSDIYSTGVILYEFLTGSRPFKGSPARMITDTLMKPAPPFAEVNPEAGVPAEIERVVLKCLEKRPEDRYQTPRELAAAFLAPLAPPTPTWPEPTTISPKKLILAVATGAGLVLAGALAVWALQPTPSPPPGPGPGPVPKPSSAGPVLPLGFTPEGDETVGGWPRVIVHSDLGVRLVRVEGNPKFEMGGIGPILDEAPPPVRNRSIPPLYVQETEFTNDQVKQFDAIYHIRDPVSWSEAYEKLKKEDPKLAGNHPAVGLDHVTATGIANRLGGRLPRAAEWEFLARSGGRKDRPYGFSDGSRPRQSDSRANIDSLTREGASTTTTPAKYHPYDRTEQGLFDMIGNVREWCAGPPDDGQKRPQDISHFEVRGGSWKSDARLFSTTVGEPVPGDAKLDDLGFRIVLDWPPKSP